MGRDVGPGVTLHGRDAGDGLPMVLLHGHPRTHTTWHHVAPTRSPSAAPGPTIYDVPRGYASLNSKAMR
jgi:pimeloyl-ACP methyl ester carboxylesterase